jgi:hypothetical protein
MEKKLAQLEQEREDYEAVRYRMDDEGMEYCFKHYSTFEEIEDEEFHKLREEFLESSTKLREYVENKLNELSSQIEDLEWGDYSN